MGGDEQGSVGGILVLAGGQVGFQPGIQLLADLGFLPGSALAAQADGTMGDVHHLADGEGANLGDAEAAVQDEGHDGTVSQEITPAASRAAGAPNFTFENKIRWELENPRVNHLSTHGPNYNKGE